MRSFKLIPLAFAVLTGFFASALSADPLDDQINASIQKYLTSVQSYGISTIQLSVLLPNETQPRNYVTGTQYYGTSDKTPASTDMMVQWGSITKEYTNVLVFKLIQKGKFTLDDTLVQLFPENFSKDQNSSQIWPDAWRDVKLYQLMNMTSGITDYTSTPSFPTGDGPIPPQPHYSLEDLTNMAAQYQEKSGCKADLGCFPVGSNYFYSNTNYIILGEVVQKYSGHSFTHEMEHLLSHFQDSKNHVYYYIGHSYPNFILKNMIHGYDSPTKPIETIDMTNYDMSWAASAGAMIGNMNALINMTQALYTAISNNQNNLVPINLLEQHVVKESNGQPVSPDQINTECALGNNDNECYAMGLYLFGVPNIGMVYGYEGQTYGYDTSYFRIPLNQSQYVIAAGSMNVGITGRASSISISDEVFNVGILVKNYLSKKMTS